MKEKNKIMNKNKVVIWGTGRRSKDMMINGVFEACDILCFVDNYRNTDDFMGYTVIAPEKLCEKKYDWLIIPLFKPSEEHPN